MFQDFEEKGGPEHVRERLEALRAYLTADRLDGFLLPSGDEFRNEYVPDHARRLLWLTGFSGSWGVAVLYGEDAALFVDGRYTLQARSETDREVFAIVKYPDSKPEAWLAERARPGAAIGYDPRLQSVQEVRALHKALAGSGAQLKPLAVNPVDALWRDRPPPRLGTIELHPLAHAGVSANEKLANLRATLRSDGQDAVILSAPDSVSWLFNIRGSDVAHTPVVLAFALVPAQGEATLFIDREDRAEQEVRAALKGVARFEAMAGLEAGIAALSGSRVRLDPERCPAWFEERLKAAGAQIVEAPDPCLLPRACKNGVEIEGARAAHRRDGAAVCRFLAWLDAHAPRGRLDEISAVEALERFRRETNLLRDISFDTISAAGPNGAIVHYRVTRRTNRKLARGELFLIDSGGQYPDGTTDITRTVAIGAVSPEMKRHFTLVLKAHIALALTRFPPGTRGVELDAIARRALWQAGLDFDHGTGHGVGSYLSVHEGPQSISRRGMAALEAGMIVSNEPGHYREGEYGIRIENLMLVSAAEPIEGGERAMHSFETLTLAPIDRRLIEASLLSDEELGWLNAYHRRVEQEIGPQLDGGERAWLAKATAPVGRPRRRAVSSGRS